MLNNKIIGEGFTSKYGDNHAEVNAVNSVSDPSLLKEATIYVTLEPCSHHGKTPPCADLLIKHQFKHVVIGCKDSNSLVAGKGIERLRKAGITVIVGVLENECRKHHKRFFTFQEKKRPYIVLKWAETQNSFIAPLNKNTQAPVWISNQYSQQLAHKLRAKEHAILVGTNTVVSDNPKLNVRSWTGENPVRIVLDKSLRISEKSHVLDNSIKTIILCDSESLSLNAGKLSKHATFHNLVFEPIHFSDDIGQEICNVVQKHGIQSLIIEGGTKTLQTFIDSNLWDEAKVFIGHKTFEDGVKAPTLGGRKMHEENIKNDILITYIND